MIKLISSEKNFAETSYIPLQNKTSPIPVSKRRNVRFVKTIPFNLFYNHNWNSGFMKYIV